MSKLQYLKVNLKMSKSYPVKFGIACFPYGDYTKAAENFVINSKLIPQMATVVFFISINVGIKFP